MLKYVDAVVTFAEIPDEITLCINLSNCPCHCEGCHSSYLAEDIGIILDKNELFYLLKQHKGITCVCFMGGDAEPYQVLTLAREIKENLKDLKVGWYSGRDKLPTGIELNLQNFDIIKLGGYNKSLGPLNYPTTNQKFYKIIEGKMYDYTYLFWKNSEIEIWKDIDGFYGYQVSNLGNVRSLNYKKTKKIQILKASLSGFNKKYKSVCMRVKGKSIRRNIHRLVAETFIPNPKNLPEINHIDEDGTNNKISNLEWCDRKYNLNYGNRTKNFIDSKSIPILQLNLDGSLIKEWKSQVEIVKELGLDLGSLSHCLHGYRIKNGKKCPVYSYHGYKWKYKDDV